jgi:hypothetical protein
MTEKLVLQQLVVPCPSFKVPFPSVASDKISAHRRFCNQENVAARLSLTPAQVENLATYVFTTVVLDERKPNFSPKFMGQFPGDLRLTEGLAVVKIYIDSKERRDD